MRTKKQLGKLMLEHFDKYFVSGLCGFFYDLQIFQIITLEEFFMLSDLIESNKPNNLSSRFVYYWKAGEKEPRTQWIKDNLINAKN